jgi:hypothetical protein
MGAKYSSVKCTPATIDYIRSKDVTKLTRQLSKRRIAVRNKKKTLNKDENNVQLLKLDVNNDEQQRSALHFAAVDGEFRFGSIGRSRLDLT